MNIHSKENIVALLFKANSSITDLLHSEMFAERWRYLKKYVKGAVKTRKGSANPWKIKAGELKVKDKVKQSKTKTKQQQKLNQKDATDTKKPKEIIIDKRAPSADFIGLDTLGRVWGNGELIDTNAPIPRHHEITGTIDVGDYRILTKEKSDLLNTFRKKNNHNDLSGSFKSDYIGYLNPENIEVVELVKNGIIVPSESNGNSYKIPKDILLGMYVEEGYISKAGHLDVSSPGFKFIVMSINKDGHLDSQLNLLGFKKDSDFGYYKSISENDLAIRSNKASSRIADEIRGMESLSQLESLFLDKADSFDKSNDILEKIKKDRSELVDKVFNFKKDDGQNKRFKSYFERSSYESLKFELEHQMKFAGPRKAMDLKSKLEMVNSLYEKESDLLDQLSKTRLDDYIKTYKDNADVIKKNISGDSLKFKVHVLPEDGVSKEDIDMVNRGVEIVQGLFSNTNKPMSDVVIKINNTNGRANSAVFGTEINIFKGTSLNTVIHEIMHQIEDQNPDIQQAIIDFRNHRVGIQKAEKIFDHDEELMHERGVEDKFGLVFKNDAKYVGKEYGTGSTEILSMGVPKLLENPKEFIRKDPEYARFLLGVMTGKIRRNGDLE